MPCSVTLPAGCGKTELIAAIAAVGQQQHQRGLILTHTHAGVDALRSRLRRFGVTPQTARVDTIASWSHQLVRRYPQLAGISVSAEPDWAESKLYYDAAQHVVQTAALQRVLKASYTYAIIDEYQDCTTSQHHLMTTVGQALPVAVFGDPLQAIFGFDGPLPDWHTDVSVRFPPTDTDPYPWRWNGHNQNLGQWLLTARDALLTGEPLIIGEPDPVQVIPAGTGNDVHAARIRTCRELRRQHPHDTIIVIGKWARDCHTAASKLGGTFTILETVEGQDMINFARIADRGTATQIARATAEFARACASGVADHITKDDVRRLGNGKSLTHLKRPGAEQALQQLTGLLTNPSSSNIRTALRTLGWLPNVRRYRHDAWNTVLKALVIADASNISVEAAVTKLRNLTRATGRPATTHAIGTTLLVKGLEFDHAVVLDPGAHEPTSLYVALTRARKTLTIIHPSRTLTTAAVLPAPRPAVIQPPTLFDDIPEFA